MFLTGISPSETARESPSTLFRMDASALRGPRSRHPWDRMAPQRAGIALRSRVAALWNFVSALCSCGLALQWAGAHEERAATREQRAVTRERRAHVGKQRAVPEFAWDRAALQRAGAEKRRAARSQARAGAALQWAGPDFGRDALDFGRIVSCAGRLLIYGLFKRRRISCGKRQGSSWFSWPPSFSPP